MNFVLTDRSAFLNYNNNNLPRYNVLQCLLATYLIKLKLIDAEFYIWQHYDRRLYTEMVNSSNRLRSFCGSAAWMEQRGQRLWRLLWSRQLGSLSIHHFFPPTSSSSCYRLSPHQILIWTYCCAAAVITAAKDVTFVCCLVCLQESFQRGKRLPITFNH